MDERADDRSGAPEDPRRSTAGDLFTPSIRPQPGGPAHWRVGSQFVVYFFGGILAGGVIAYLNCARLGLGERARRLVLLSTAAGLVATLVAAALIPTGDSTSPVRLASRVIAVVFGYVPVARLQRAAERAAELRGVEPASLWGPGFAAVLGLGFVQAMLLIAVVGTA